MTKLEKFKKAIQLSERGYNDYEIAKQLQMHRSTVKNWLKQDFDESKLISSKGSTLEKINNYPLKELKYLIQNFHSKKDILLQMGCKNIHKYYAFLQKRLDRENLKMKYKKHVKSAQFNWEKIQKYYNQGYSCRETARHFDMAISTIFQAANNNLIKTRSRSEAGKLAHKLKPESYKRSEKTKNKISKRRKAFLKANPDKVPYVLNHHSNGESYPEKYFAKCFEHADIGKKYRILNYELDFANVKNKINIEIDGSQHFVDPRIVKHDIKRNAILSELGWSIFRISWPGFRKLKMEEKTNIIKQVILYQNPNHPAVLYIEPKTSSETIKKYAYKMRDNQYILNSKTNTYHKIKSKCPECNEPKSKLAQMCRKCFGKHRHSQEKINRPSYKTLIQDIKTTSYRKTGKKYGVSDNAIRKWIKSYRKYMVGLEEIESP